jgi:hypothetical protein
MCKRVFGTTLMIFFDCWVLGIGNKKFGCWHHIFLTKKVWMLTVFVCFPFILDMMKDFFSLNLFIIHQIKSEKMHSVLRTMRARKQQQMVKMMRHGEKGW